jgi:4'-phosphopantetheinyl transferase
MMQAQWEPGPMRPQLAADVVDVWQADLAVGGGDVRGLLSDDERERAARFVRAEDGARWAHARGILRALLGRYAAADPRALCFAEGPHGKPRLDDEAISFNLSHSSEVLLVAVARDREVGVDVELPRRSVDHVAIARRILAADEADRIEAIEDPQQREREFLRAWVRWEATLKCSGFGIGGGNAPSAGPEPWIRELAVGGPAAAALAVAAGPVVVRCWQWPVAG